MTRTDRPTEPLRSPLLPAAGPDTIPAPVALHALGMVYREERDTAVEDCEPEVSRVDRCGTILPGEMMWGGDGMVMA